MQGQKQLYMFLMFIIFIVAFNFCRKAIKRDKELKQQRDDAIKRKVEANIIEQKLEMERKAQEQEIKRQQEIINRMKEHKDKCYDLYIFGVRPQKEYLRKPYRIINNGQNDKVMEIGSSSSASKLTINEHINAKQNNNNLSEPIIILFILVLIYFLMKAASDITQHFKKKSEQKNCPSSRRCSLQEYADKKSSKAKFSSHRSISVDTHIKQQHTSIKTQEHKRRLSTSINSGVAPEQGSPFKIINGIGHRPLPLLRRCSVPSFSLYQPGSTILRRPSMESFSEGDSSPDIKRRVRMLHRH